MTDLTPAQVVARTGVSVDTLRYYEREGLIGPVRRTLGGHRSFTEDDLFWIGLVTCLREAGLGIADLRSFTEMLRSQGTPADKVAFLTDRRGELERRRAAIDTALGVLAEKIDHYSGDLESS